MRYYTSCLFLLSSCCLLMALLLLLLDHPRQVVVQASSQIFVSIDTQNNYLTSLRFQNNGSSYPLCFEWFPHAFNRTEALRLCRASGITDLRRVYYTLSYNAIPTNDIESIINFHCPSRDGQYLEYDSNNPENVCTYSFGSCSSKAQVQLFCEQERNLVSMLGYGFYDNNTPSGKLRFTNEQRIYLNPGGAQTTHPFPSPIVAFANFSNNPNTKMIFEKLFCPPGWSEVGACSAQVISASRFNRVAPEYIISSCSLASLSSSFLDLNNDCYVEHIDPRWNHDTAAIRYNVENYRIYMHESTGLVLVNFTSSDSSSSSSSRNLGLGVIGTSGNTQSTLFYTEQSEETLLRICNHHFNDELTTTNRSKYKPYIFWYGQLSLSEYLQKRNSLSKDRITTRFNLKVFDPTGENALNETVHGNGLSDVYGFDIVTPTPGMSQFGNMNETVLTQCEIVDSPTVEKTRRSVFSGGRGHVGCTLFGSCRRVLKKEYRSENETENDVINHFSEVFVPFLQNRENNNNTSVTTSGIMSIRTLSGSGIFPISTIKSLESAVSLCRLAGYENASLETVSFSENNISAVEYYGGAEVIENRLVTGMFWFSNVDCPMNASEFYRDCDFEYMAKWRMPQNEFQVGSASFTGVDCNSTRSPVKFELLSSSSSNTTSSSGGILLALPPQHQAVSGMNNLSSSELYGPICYSSSSFSQSSAIAVCSILGFHNPYRVRYSKVLWNETTSISSSFKINEHRPALSHFNCPIGSTDLSACSYDEVANIADCFPDDVMINSSSTGNNNSGPFVIHLDCQAPIRNISFQIDPEYQLLLIRDHDNETNSSSSSYKSLCVSSTQENFRLPQETISLDAARTICHLAENVSREELDAHPPFVWTRGFVGKLNFGGKMSTAMKNVTPGFSAISMNSIFVNGATNVPLDRVELLHFEDIPSASPCPLENQIAIDCTGGRRVKWEISFQEPKSQPDFLSTSGIFRRRVHVAPVGSSSSQFFPPSSSFINSNTENVAKGMCKVVFGLDQVQNENTDISISDRIFQPSVPTSNPLPPLCPLYYFSQPEYMNPSTSQSYNNVVSFYTENTTIRNNHYRLTTTSIFDTKWMSPSELLNAQCGKLFFVGCELSPQSAQYTTLRKRIEFRTVTEQNLLQARFPLASSSTQGKNWGFVQKDVTNLNNNNPNVFFETCRLMKGTRSQLISHKIVSWNDTAAVTDSDNISYTLCDLGNSENTSEPFVGSRISPDGTCRSSTFLSLNCSTPDPVFIGLARSHPEQPLILHPGNTNHDDKDTSRAQLFFNFSSVSSSSSSSSLLTPLPEYNTIKVTLQTNDTEHTVWKVIRFGDSTTNSNSRIIDQQTVEIEFDVFNFEQFSHNSSMILMNISADVPSTMRNRHFVFNITIIKIESDHSNSYQLPENVKERSVILRFRPLLPIQLQRTFYRPDNLTWASGSFMDILFFSSIVRLTWFLSEEPIFGSENIKVDKFQLAKPTNPHARLSVNHTKYYNEELQYYHFVDRKFEVELYFVPGSYDRGPFFDGVDFSFSNARPNLISQFDMSTYNPPFYYFSLVPPRVIFLSNVPKYLFGNMPNQTSLLQTEGAYFQFSVDMENWMRTNTLASANVMVNNSHSPLLVGVNGSSSTNTMKNTNYQLNVITSLNTSSSHHHHQKDIAGLPPLALLNSSTLDPQFTSNTSIRFRFAFNSSSSNEGVPSNLALPFSIGFAGHSKLSIEQNQTSRYFYDFRVEDTHVNIVVATLDVDPEQFGQPFVSEMQIVSKKNGLIFFAKKENNFHQVTVSPRYEYYDSKIASSSPNRFAVGSEYFVSNEKNVVLSNTSDMFSKEDVIWDEICKNDFNYVGYLYHEWISVSSSSSSSSSQAALGICLKSCNRKNNNNTKITSLSECDLDFCEQQVSSSQANNNNNARLRVVCQTRIPTSTLTHSDEITRETDSLTLTRSRVATPTRTLPETPPDLVQFQLENDETKLLLARTRKYLDENRTILSPFTPWRYASLYQEVVISLISGGWGAKNNNTEEMSFSLSFENMTTVCRNLGYKNYHGTEIVNFLGSRFDGTDWRTKQFSICIADCVEEAESFGDCDYGFPSMVTDYSFSRSASYPKYTGAFCGRYDSPPDAEIPPNSEYYPYGLAVNCTGKLNPGDDTIPPDTTTPATPVPPTTSMAPSSSSSSSSSTSTPQQQTTSSSPPIDTTSPSSSQQQTTTTTTSTPTPTPSSDNNNNDNAAAKNNNDDSFLSNEGIPILSAVGGLLLLLLLLFFVFIYRKRRKSRAAIHKDENDVDYISTSASASASSSSNKKNNKNNKKEDQNAMTLRLMNEVARDDTERLLTGEETVSRRRERKYPSSRKGAARRSIIHDDDDGENEENDTTPASSASPTKTTSELLAEHGLVVNVSEQLEDNNDDDDENDDNTTGNNTTKKINKQHQSFVPSATASIANFAAGDRDSVASPLLSSESSSSPTTSKRKKYAKIELSSSEGPTTNDANQYEPAEIVSEMTSDKNAKNNNNNNDDENEDDEEDDVETSIRRANRKRRQQREELKRNEAASDVQDVLNRLKESVATSEDNGNFSPRETEEQRQTENENENEERTTRVAMPLEALETPASPPRHRIGRKVKPLMTNDDL